MDQSLKVHNKDAASGGHMAYAIVHFFPGGTKEQYEAVLKAVHPSKDSLPEGQIFHTAGASRGGWTIMAVHETKASWEKFRDTSLMPKIKQGIPGGFKTAPQETEFETYKLVQGSQAIR
jgi:hypothetical protein